VLLGKISCIRAHLKELWTSRGAIELGVPLLVPVIKKESHLFGDIAGT